MKNNKGQALIEFIMILPVLLLIMTCIFDIGSIIYKKYAIQNDLDLISNYVLNEEIDYAKTIASKNKLILNITNNDDIITLKLEYKMKLNTPGLNRILGNPYKIIEEKTIYKKRIETADPSTNLPPNNVDSSDNIGDVDE